MADIIQQLLDLKEWAQNPERYERRLNFRGAGLVQPGPEGVRQGYARPGGNPAFGTEITGAIHKGKIQPKNQEKLNKLMEIITESNNSYTKSIASNDALVKAGWKGGWQDIATEGSLRQSIKKETSKINTTFQKMDNYVNNVMLAEDALVKDFRSPKEHLAKKFGVSRGTMDNWSSPKQYNSKVYQDNIELFHGLRNELSFNKFKLLPDGTPRLIADYSLIAQEKLPSKAVMYGADEETRFILRSAERNYLQMKAAGLDPKVRFVTDPTITSMNEWQFIDNETGRLFSTDASIDTVEYQGKSYKNNYLNHAEARKLYKEEFGNIYKMFDEDLAKYMAAEVIDPKSKQSIKLDTLLRRQAKELTGKKSFLDRRFMDIDHGDLWEDPFGRKDKNNLRLIDRKANQSAGILKRLEKYKNNPKLLASKLDEVGYNKKFNNTDELIKFYGDEVIKQRKWKVKPPKAGAALDNLIKKVPQILKVLRKGASVGKTGVTGFLTGIGFGPGGVALEAALEGAVYEYFRRKGYSDKWAEAETFTYRLLKEAAKGKSTKDVPWYGGADELKEKDLYQLRGEEGKVIGERKAVKRYIDNEKALLEAEEKYNQLYTDYKTVTVGRYGSEERGDKYYKAMEKTWEKMNSIEDQLDLDRDSYNAAKEKQETELGVEAIKYGHYGRGDTERLAKKREERRHQEFLDYRQGKQRARLLPKGKLEERVEDPLAETPYTFLKTEETLPAFSLKYDPTLGEGGAFSQRFPWEDMPRYRGDEGKKRKWQDIYDAGGWDLMDKIGIAGGVANMARGGIANVRRPNAIPPVSGPMPQGGGLSSQFNRVKKLME